MTTWAGQPELRTVLYAPVGLRLIDDLTGETPAGLRLVDQLSGPTRGDLAATLLESIGGDLQPTGIRPVLTPSGILAYPGLGRAADPSSAPPRQFEIRIEADRYRPLYRSSSTGIAFTAFPYDDELHPPASVPTGPIETRLVPSPAYSFPNHLAVLRGTVTDGGQPVADALVSVTVTVGGADVVDLALSDDGGHYALPLRWVEPGVATTVEAVSLPPLGSGRQGQIVITVPTDLGTNQEIPLT